MTDLLPLLPNVAALSALVPREYAPYMPAVAAALNYFLGHLSPARQERILIEQADLPSSATPIARLVHLLHQSPALHKLGQVLARRRELHISLRRRLQRLESMEPRTPLADLLPILDQDLADLRHRYHIRFARRPLAEASVAVVLPITWREHRGEPAQAGVLKVLKPGVSAALHEDLDLLADVGGHLDRFGGELGIPAAGYRQVFEEVRTLLSHEVHLPQEQAHLRDAARQFENASGVCVPGLLPFCTPRITAMQRIRGVKATNPGCIPAANRRAVGEALVRALLADVMFTQNERIIFHGDPHAGNLLAMEDGKIALIDWALAGRLHERDREQLARLLVGAATRDPRTLTEAVESLAHSAGLGRRALDRIDLALQNLSASPLPDIGWVMHLLDGLASEGLRFPSRLMLFRKVYFTLEGVLADLCPGCSLDSMLQQEAIRRLWAEWPQRLFSMPLSRRLPTHLSNSDLWRIATSTAMRLWTGS